MKTNIIIKLISKRIERKKEQLQVLENSIRNEPTPECKKEYLEFKSALSELEAVLIIIETVQALSTGNE